MCWKCVVGSHQQPTVASALRTPRNSQARYFFSTLPLSLPLVLTRTVPLLFSPVQSDPHKLGKCELIERSTDVSGELVLSSIEGVAEGMETPLCPSLLFVLVSRFALYQ
jgi:hypothetical protein